MKIIRKYMKCMKGVNKSKTNDENQSAASEHKLGN